MIPCFKVSTADIQKELKVASMLQENQHKNIVQLLKHGRSKFNFYFIDMELCEMTLSDYIRDLRDKKPCMFNSDIVQTLRPVFVPGDAPSEGRLTNTWMIGVHIADGLAFMHGHKYAHRDLKPSNGMNVTCDV